MAIYFGYRKGKVCGVCVCVCVCECVSMLGSQRVHCNWWHFGSYMVNGDFNFLREIIPLNTEDHVGSEDHICAM